MGYTTVDVTAPHGTAYDEDYPTRSTENYAHSLHNILQDMEDAAGDWYLTDGYPSTAHTTAFLENLHDNIEVVFDYADSAITEHRAEESITLSKPVYDDLSWGVIGLYPVYAKAVLDNYKECMQMMYKIYYMWKTEEDPLLLKEKLQELLVAWPLTDTEITLNEEGGQTMRITPAWKNVDI